MAESKNSTTTRVLKTQRAVMNWTLLLADLLLLAVLAAGLALLLWKGPKNSVSGKRRLLSGLAALAVSGGALAGGWALAFQTNQLSTVFSNLAFAYEDYGFSY